MTERRGFLIFFFLNGLPKYIFEKRRNLYIIHARRSMYIDCSEFPRIVYFETIFKGQVLSCTLYFY